MRSWRIGLVSSRLKIEVLFLYPFYERGDATQCVKDSYAIFRKLVTRVD